MIYTRRRYQEASNWNCEGVLISSRSKNSLVLYFSIARFSDQVLISFKARISASFTNPTLLLSLSSFLSRGLNVGFKEAVESACRETQVV